MKTQQEQLPVIKGSPKTLKHNWRGRYGDRAACNHDPKCTTGNGVCDYLGRAGAGWLERKASGELVYHTPWLRAHKPFAMVEPKPRIETSEKALIRLRKVFEHDTTRSSCEKARQYHGQGYRLEATNGHWALLVKTSEKLDKAGKQLYFEVTAKHQAVKLDNPELHLALKRAKTMMDERSQCISLVSLKDGQLGVYSAHSDAGEFFETVGERVAGELPAIRPWGVSFNYDYLEPLLGCWALTMHIQDSDSAVIFEPADKSWRFVLMPMRGDTAAELRKRFEGGGK